ncbi:MAG TPA: LytTR family DNA-binding domain-containing protein [Phenylobacterium sp.]
MAAEGNTPLGSLKAAADLAARPLRVALVDDEPPALRRLQMALEKAKDVVVVGEAGDGASALQLIGRGGIDVVLVDIRMPGLSGLDLVRAIDPATAPAFIFVTAFSRFAADAFDLAAVDYLLKPVEFGRLHEALERARAALSSRNARSRIAELEEVVAALRAAEAEPAQSGYAEEIWVPDRGDRLRLPVALIDWVEAERDYVRIHSRGRSFLVRKAIRKLQAELDPADFLRVHRGALVRRDRIVRLARRPGGPSAVVLQTGAEVPVARRQAAQVRRIVGTRGA